MVVVVVEVVIVVEVVVVVVVVVMLVVVVESLEIITCTALRPRQRWRKSSSSG